MIALAAIAQPRAVGPFEFLVVPDDGGVLRRQFEEESERISLHHDVAVRVANFEFVERALAHAGNENLPHARSAETAHRMKAPVPVIEIADDTDALRIRRPDGEARAGHAIDHAQLRAELVVDLPLIAFAEEIKILFAQRRQKRIRIAHSPRLARVIRDDEVVGINMIGLLAHAFEDARLVDALQLNARLVALVHRLHFDVRGVGHESAHDHAGAIAQRVHAEERVRRAMLDLDQTLHFRVRQNHARTMAHLRQNTKFQIPQTLRTNGAPCD